MLIEAMKKDMEVFDMSTRSTIGIKRKDGTETRIYCHHDGYIEHNGAILQLAYNTAEKVEELLKLGDLSILGYYTEPKEGVHDFDNHQLDVCVAYHRDRGEAFRQSGTVEEFNYTFDENDAIWIVNRYIENEEVGEDILKMLDLDYAILRKDALLIKELLESEISEHWEDDEFASRENLEVKFMEKAIEARQKIMRQKQEEYESYYRSWCD